ncbi:MAG: hypothetical protein LGB54_01150 [Sulfurovum sp.]|nr:hypothetical protein [Sulfurovum sp.]
MSSSLDKLKALTNKLEEEIWQKKSQTIMPHVVHEKREETAVVSMATPVNRSRKEKTKKALSNDIRHNNKERVRVLYEKLKIYEKSPDFNNIFLYKAMNLSGIGLKEEDFGEVREGKYIQVIAITYEPDKNGKKRAKNISLGYFGKAETLEFRLKNEIIEFVLRWRYEKVFQNAEHYKDLIAKINTPLDTLF